MTPVNAYSRLQNSRLWDLSAASPSIILCIFAIGGFAIQIHDQWPKLNPGIALQVISELSSSIFLALQIVLLCIRRLPILKADGVTPRLWAIVGSNFSYLLLLLPKVSPPPPVAILSTVIVFSGTASSIVVLASLGKAFAIFPQARLIVTRGPYKIVRHPLYLAEQISSLGISLQFLQPWGFFIALIGLPLQFPRMQYEEKVLQAAFPEYRAYAERTARIIPFIY